MKARILIVSFMACTGLFAKAQVIPSANPLDTLIRIELPKVHHAYLNTLVSNRGGTTLFKYLDQVKDYCKDTSQRNLKIAVVVPASLVLELYTLAGNLPENIATVYNAEIKALLLPQIMGVRPLAAAIQRSLEVKKAETERLVVQGLLYLQKLND